MVALDDQELQIKAFQRLVPCGKIELNLSVCVRVESRELPERNVMLGPDLSTFVKSSAKGRGTKPLATVRAFRSTPMLGCARGCREKKLVKRKKHKKWPLR
jgi:hypothetical protein